MAGRPKVVIHGGMHKTGTSSVQAALAADRKGLLDAGIWYPPSGPAECARLINPKRGDWSEGCLRQTVDSVLRSGAHALLFSFEGVSSFSQAQFAELTAAFADCDLTYVFVFRRWDRYLPSRWMQYVRRRDSQTLGRYLERASTGDHIDVRFDLVLERARGSGRCGVKAVSYDWAIHDDGDVRPALFRSVGLAPALQAKPPVEAEWRNRTPDRERGEVVRLLNGALADRCGLPQDDNFQAMMEGRLVDVPFAISIKAIPGSLNDEILRMGRASLQERSFAADWPRCGRHIENYRAWFDDLNDRPVFPAMTDPRFTFWSLEWQALSGRAEVETFLEPLVPVVAQRLAERSGRRAAKPISGD